MGAVKYCESKSMKLPVIDSEAANKLVYDIAVRNGLGSYWINGNDIGYESDWKNTDGELIKFKPWHQVEPNGGRGENCIHGLFYPNGIWNDISCGSTQGVICDPVKKQ
uniref:C-type lectin n=1 Tax=Dugesia japonica TaxID=6161 RepID=A0A1L2DBR5_DUGJA|nr:C-type lectin [Dugesia japonica]